VVWSGSVVIGDGEKGDSQKKHFGFFYLMALKMRERKRKKNLSEAADN